MCCVALPCLFVCLCLLLSFFLLSSLIKTCNDIVLQSRVCEHCEMIESCTHAEFPILLFNRKKKKNKTEAEEHGKSVKVEITSIISVLQDFLDFLKVSLRFQHVLHFDVGRSVF